MIASAITASWSVPCLMLAIGATALGYPGPASVAGTAAFWLLASSCAISAGTLALSAIGQRSADDAAVRTAAPALGDAPPEPLRPS
jgi:hypothetical protein